MKIAAKVPEALRAITKNKIAMEYGASYTYAEIERTEYLEIAKAMLCIDAMSKSQKSRNRQMEFMMENGITPAAGAFD